MPPTTFLPGFVSGAMTVVAEREKVKRNRTVLCRCGVCGELKVVRVAALLNNVSRGCGCVGSWNRTHNESRASPEYRVWRHVKERCSNRRAKEFQWYGGRGITMCARWRNSFEAFLSDMGRKPFPRATIDRVDNNGNYEPTNCRWASYTQQANNTSRTVFITIDGVRRSLSEWATLSGVGRNTIWVRIKKLGMEPKAAVFFSPYQSVRAR